jgi:hypothetical protein
MSLQQSVAGGNIEALSATNNSGDEPLLPPPASAHGCGDRTQL